MASHFVTKTMHAYLDDPVALSLIVMPFVLQLGSSHPLATWLAAIACVAAFALVLFTDHKFGLFRVIRYKTHVAIDLLVGVMFLLAPFVLDFSVLDAWYYWATAVAVITGVSLSGTNELATPSAAES